MVVANSLALTLGGITRELADAPGGTIVRFPDGTPMAFSSAPGYARYRTGARNDAEQLIEGLRPACREYNAYGIGTVRDPWVAREQVPVYQALWERGELTVRSRLMLAPMAATQEERMAIIEGFGVRSGFGDDLLKLWDSSSAWTVERKEARSTSRMSTIQAIEDTCSGSLTIFLTIITFAVRRGWKIGTHAIGDRAVRTL